MQNLKRFPFRKNETLQAWDAADELLVATLLANYASILDSKNSKIIVLNDSFGALSKSLLDRASACPLVTYTDSFLGTQAIKLNTPPDTNILSDLAQLDGPFDLAIVRIPKNLSFFEDQLCHLSQHLKPGAPLVCGYMIKHQSKGAFELIQRIVGPTSTSLAKKKARLIFAKMSAPPTRSPYPKSVMLDGFRLPFIHHSNVFSREKLDIGTRFFIENLPTPPTSSDSSCVVLDLGCGNGALGISFKLHNPFAQLLFTDESKMAVMSAQANYEHFSNDLPSPPLFAWTHAATPIHSNSVDLVLCNPPFHQGNALDQRTSHYLFGDAARVLKTGGSLYVVGNRHLHYLSRLKHFFTSVREFASHSKFQLFEAKGPKKL